MLRNQRIIAVLTIGAVFAVFASGYVIGDMQYPEFRHRLSAEIQRIVDTAEPVVDESADPIETEQEAIDRSIQWYTHGVTRTEPISGIGKLVSTQVFRSWTGTSDSGDSPWSPIWVVGLVGVGVHADPSILLSSEIGSTADVTTTLLSSEIGSTTDVTTTIDGYLIAWDANTGQPIMEGPLSHKQGESIDDIIALHDEVLLISRATLAPTEDPLGTPTP